MQEPNSEFGGGIPDEEPSLAALAAEVSRDFPGRAGEVGGLLADPGLTDEDRVAELLSVREAAQAVRIRAFATVRPENTEENTPWGVRTTAVQVRQKTQTNPENVSYHQGAAEVAVYAIGCGCLAISGIAAYNRDFTNGFMLAAGGFTLLGLTRAAKWFNRNTLNS